MHNTFKRPSFCIVVTENVRADKMNSKKQQKALEKYYWKVMKL